MIALLFWTGFVLFVVLIAHSPLFGVAERLLDADDPEPYYPPKSSARAAVKAMRVPEHQTTTKQEAD